MLKDFKDSFDLMVSNRASEIADELLTNNTEYTEAGDKASTLFHQIRELLPEEYRHLLYDYESLIGLQEVINQDIMYEQGLKDGIQLKNILKLVV